MRERPDGRSRPRAGSRPAGSVVASRPAARRSGGSGGGPGAASRTSAPRYRARLTSRAVVLGVVLVVLGLSYVFPLRVYLGQQAEVAQLRASQERQRERIAELSAEAQLWADDEYVRIQARERLYFGEPGEILLIPVWEQEDAPRQPDPGVQAEPPPPAPWWDTLWASVEAADGAGAG